MQIKSLLFSGKLTLSKKGKLLIFISLPMLLTCCNGNTIPEESFELPTGAYPKLVDVPDRPTYPATQEVAAIQKNLESSHATTVIAAKPTV